MRRTIATLVLIACTLAGVGGQSPTTTVTGVVLDATGAVLPGVTVTLQDADGQNRTTTTDDAGRFAFKGVAAGHYHLRAELPGFNRLTREVDASAGEVASVTLTLAVGGMIETSPTSGEEPIGRNHFRIPVFYATDRNEIAEPALTYGIDREPRSSLHLGRFVVSIPRRHEIGHIERPDIWSVWRQDPDRHFIIVQRNRWGYETFYSELRDYVGRTDEKAAFVFIHGFNVLFEDAVFHTAQLAYDLGFDGAPILYSWPSVGRVADYRIDERNNEWTVNRLRWFLEDLRQKSGATVIHLVAHSMGNRALAAALAQMAPSGSRQAQFSQIVMAAPDIDAGIFPDLAARMRRLAGRITVYSSEHDLALEAARRYDTFQRVGSTKPQIVLVAGIDVVDASKVDTSLVGHSYFGDTTKVLSDLYYVMKGHAAKARAFITAIGQAPDTYWAFR